MIERSLQVKCWLMDSLTARNRHDGKGISGKTKQNEGYKDQTRVTVKMILSNPQLELTTTFTKVGFNTNMTLHPTPRRNSTQDLKRYQGSVN